MNKTISISKAIAIILMVVGHAGCPTLLHDLIYAFHMPLFFFVSGYLFKDKYLSEPFDFVKRKVKGLYVPFVKWSLIFLVFHNVLCSLGCYEFPYTAKEFGSNAIRYVAMLDSEQLLGGFWFLKTLLIASIFAFAIIKICKRMHTYIHTYMAAIMLLIISYLMSIAPFKIPCIPGNAYLATFMFLSGYIFKESGKESALNKWYVPLLGFAGCLSLVMFTPGGVGSIDVTGAKLFLYTVAALCGTFAVYSLSYFISKYLPRISELLVGVGKKTLYILTFHFISFKLVSLLLIKVMGVEGNLYDFPVIPNLGGGWWVLYSIVGVIVPVMLWNLNDKISKKLFKK